MSIGYEVITTSERSALSHRVTKSSEIVSQKQELY